MTIQSILNGIPNGTDAEKVKYLFNDTTIQGGSKLKQNEIPIIEIELKKILPAKTVNDWIRLIKQKTQPDKLSHIDISNIYLKSHKNDTLYARSNYHRYADGVWSIIPEMTFYSEIQILLEKLEQHRGITFTYGNQKSIASFITQKIAIRDECLDANPDLINMKNGTFSIENQVLMSHEATDFLTTQLPFDHEYGAKTSEWIKYLFSTLMIKADAFGNWEPDLDIIGLLQEAIGYSLTSSMQFHKSFWCLGEGRNGKGVLFHILQALGGSAATAFNLDTLNQSFNTYHLAELAGKRIVYCTEVGKNFDFSGDAMFKAITGGDKIQVRQIQEKPFVMESISKVWVSMNDFPHIKDTSYGFWSRLVVIPFNMKFDENNQDSGLREKLENELPGIFNWAMIGLIRLFKNEKFTQSEQVKDLTAKHKLESNTVEMFVNEECELRHDYLELVTTIYGTYKEWAKDSNYHPYSKKNFKKELDKLKHGEKRTGKGIHIEGLKIRVKPINI